MIHTSSLATCDVFSLGVSLFLLAFAHPPFRVSTKACPYWSLVAKGDWNKYWSCVDKTNKYDNEFRSLIQGMLEPNPEKRLTINDVL